MRKKKHAGTQARRMVGHPVCLQLKDGSYYVGQIIGVRNGEVILSGVRGTGTLSQVPTARERAQVSGLLDTLFGKGGSSRQELSPQPQPANSFSYGGFGMPGLGASAAPQPAAPAASGGLGALGGMVGKYWPTVKVGLGMLRYVWPLVGKFILK